MEGWMDAGVNGSRWISLQLESCVLAVWKSRGGLWTVRMEPPSLLSSRGANQPNDASHPENICQQSDSTAT